MVLFIILLSVPFVIPIILFNAQYDGIDDFFHGDLIQFSIILGLIQAVYSLLMFRLDIVVSWTMNYSFKTLSSKQFIDAIPGFWIVKSTLHYIKFNI